MIGNPVKIVLNRIVNGTIYFHSTAAVGSRYLVNDVAVCYLSCVCTVMVAERLRSFLNITRNCIVTVTLVIQKFLKGTKLMIRKMIPVCVYCDTTGLYSEEEMNKDNLVDLVFPREIVESYYMENKDEYDEETSFELKIPTSECNFDIWLNDVYTADDTQNLYDFAKRCGFVAEKR